MRFLAPVLMLIIGVAVQFHDAATARETSIPRKLDEPTAERLAAEAVFGADKLLEYLDYDENISRTFTPPFIVFDGLSKPPAEGSFGFFAVNPWTGDVRNMWGCHRLSTPALRKSQAEIRRRFTAAEMKQYARLRSLKPICTIEG